MMWVQMQTVKEAHFFMFGHGRFYKIKLAQQARFLGNVKRQFY